VGKDLEGGEHGPLEATILKSEYEDWSILRKPSVGVLGLQFLRSMLSDERMVLSFTTDAGLRQRSHSPVWVPRHSWPYFTASDSRLPQPGGPGPRVYIPKEQGGLAIPQGHCVPIFLASYDSQGCGGGIRPHLHTRMENWFTTGLPIVSRRSQRKHIFCCQECVFIGPLHSNGCPLLWRNVRITQQRTVYQDSVSEGNFLSSHCLRHDVVSNGF
jgi:hypothetical protein